VEKKMNVQKIGIVLILVSLIVWSGCMKDIELDAGTQDFYDRYRVFMTKDELQLLRSLPDMESRSEFMADFWSSRDPDPASQENEFKIEVDERIATANRLFREGGGPGYDTDRGRIYILLGPPDNIQQRSSIQSRNGTGVEWWIYDRWQLAIPFVSKFGSKYRLSTTNPSLLEAVNTAKEEAITNLGKGGAARLRPEVAYDGAKNVLVVSVKASQISFQQEDQSFIGKVKLEATFYRGSEKERVSVLEDINLSQQKLLNTEKFSFELPVVFTEGKILARVVVSDVLGNRRVRKIKTFKIK
jgi:GWxTD domain-containing protein